MIKCPVCAEYDFEEEDDYDVCPVCEWENDSLQLKRPDYWGGANELSLNDFRREWQKRNESVGAGVSADVHDRMPAAV